MQKNIHLIRLWILRLSVAGFLFLHLLPGMLIAAPGDVIFNDDFERAALGADWTIDNSGGGDAAIGAHTANSGSRSLYTSWDIVYVTSKTFDLSAAAGVQLDLWVRRGDDVFSEDPENAGTEDLVIEYLNDVGSWQQLSRYIGGGTPGQIFTPTMYLPSDALHAAFQLRFRQTGGDGSDWDYWHVDDVVLTETAGPPTIVFPFCDDFESGTVNWQILTSGGDAGTGTHTSSSASNSLYLRWGDVSVTSYDIDLSAETSPYLNFWLRRGDDSFSEDPDGNEDFVVEYFNSSSAWVELETFGGNGTPGQTYNPSYALPADALHSAFKIRFTMENGDGADNDYWHVDDVCVEGPPPPPTALATYSLDEASWGAIVDGSGNGNDASVVGAVLPNSVSPAITTNPGTCGYADIPFNDSDNTYDAIDTGLDVDGDIGNVGTIDFWYKSNEDWNGGNGDRQLFDASTTASGQKYFYLTLQNNSSLSFGLEDSSDNDFVLEGGNNNFNAGEWVHVAITWDLPSDRLQIYVNGSLDDEQTFSTNGVLGNMDTLYFGDNRSTYQVGDMTGNSANGSIDEIGIYGFVLSQGEIQTNMNATHPCPGLTPPVLVCTTTTIPSGEELKGISGVGNSDVTAVAKKGEVYNYDGSAWNVQSVTNDPGEDLDDVYAIDASTSVAVGKKGVVLMESAGSWSNIASSPIGEDLKGVWAYSASDVYVVGKKGTIYSYDYLAGAWQDLSSVSGADINNDDFEDAWGDGTYFYGLTKDGELYRYTRAQAVLTPAAWSTINSCVAGGVSYKDLWGDASGNIYLAGKDNNGGAVYRYNGASCSLVATASEDLEGIYGSATSGEIYAVGKKGVLLYFNGVGWSESTVGADDLKDVWVSASGIPFYAGKNGTVTTCSPFSALDHFVITHDGMGISCLAEAIKVTAAQADGSTDTTYTGGITLDTQSGTGSWALNSGTPANFNDATAGDGVATYTFDAADNGVATFDLDYQTGTGSINVDAFDGATRDDDSEGNLVFSPNGFTVTAAALSNPPPGVISASIPAQTAARDFTLHLAAYGQTPTDATCGIIESYTGAQSINFWSTYNNPATGTFSLAVDGSSVATTEAASVAQAVTFANGQASVVVNYADAGQVTLSMKDGTTGNPDLPNGIAGASQPITMLPAGLCVESTDLNADCAAGDETCSAFVPAGQAFNLTVKAVSWEVGGDTNFCTGNATTPNFQLSNIAVSQNLVAPAAGVPGTLGTTSFDMLAADNGDHTVSQTISEVGVFTFTATPPLLGYFGETIAASTSANIGRFYPDHFVTAISDGSFANTCTTGTAFTYLGENFTYLSNPTVTATAENTAGVTTANYTGVWAPLTTAGVGLTYPAVDGTQLDQNTTAPAPIVVTSTTGAPSRVDNANGSITFTLGGLAADSFSYDRSLGRVAPFNADLTIQLTAVTDGEASASDLGAPKNIVPLGNLQRFGRGAAEDVHGTMSQVGDSLTVPVATLFFDVGGVWTLNSDDSCAQNQYAYVTTDADISTFASPANPVSLVNGLGDLTLSITADGGVAGGRSLIDTVWPTWLKYDFDGVDQLGDGNFYDDDPSATATFGIFRGDDRYLYWREAP